MAPGILPVQPVSTRLMAPHSCCQQQLVKPTSLIFSELCVLVIIPATRLRAPAVPLTCFSEAVLLIILTEMAVLHHLLTGMPILPSWLQVLWIWYLPSIRAPLRNSGT